MPLFFKHAPCPIHEPVALLANTRLHPHRYSLGSRVPAAVAQSGVTRIGNLSNSHRRDVLLEKLVVVSGADPAEAEKFLHDVTSRTTTWPMRAAGGSSDFLGLGGSSLRAGSGGGDHHTSAAHKVCTQAYLVCTTS